MSDFIDPKAGFARVLDRTDNGDRNQKWDGLGYTVELSFYPNGLHGRHSIHVYPSGPRACSPQEAVSIHADSTKDGAYFLSIIPSKQFTCESIAQSKLFAEMLLKVTAVAEIIQTIFIDPVNQGRFDCDSAYIPAVDKEDA